MNQITELHKLLMICSECWLWEHSFDDRGLFIHI